MKAKLVIGYTLGGVGLLLIVWNGYLLVSGSSVDFISLGIGILAYVIGVVLIKKNKRVE